MDSAGGGKGLEPTECACAGEAFPSPGVQKGRSIQVYADDTSFHLGKWTDSLSKSLQRDFNSRQRWLLDNKWVLNPKETQAVSYRTDGKLKRMEARVCSLSCAPSRGALTLVTASI